MSKELIRVVLLPGGWNHKSLGSETKLRNPDQLLYPKPGFKFKFYHCLEIYWKTVYQLWPFFNNQGSLPCRVHLVTIVENLRIDQKLFCFMVKSFMFQIFLVLSWEILLSYINVFFKESDGEYFGWNRVNFVFVITRNIHFLCSKCPHSI